MMLREQVSAGRMRRGISLRRGLAVSLLAAFALARHGEKFYLGRFYQETKPVLEDQFNELKEPSRPWREVMEEIFDSMS